MKKELYFMQKKVVRPKYESNKLSKTLNWKVEISLIRSASCKISVWGSWGFYIFMTQGFQLSQDAELSFILTVLSQKLEMYLTWRKSVQCELINYFRFSFLWKIIQLWSAIYSLWARKVLKIGLMSYKNFLWIFQKLKKRESLNFVAQKALAKTKIYI